MPLFTRRHALCGLAALFGGNHAHARYSVSSEPPDSTRQPTSSFREKIVRGELTTFEEHPWQVELNIQADGYSVICGGAVIGARWILTAAHCVAGATAKHVQAIVVDGVSLDVVEIIVHEKYKHDEERQKEYPPPHDLALVRVHSTRPAAVIRLATPTTEIPIGKELIVTGKGKTEDRESSDQLREGKVPYVDNETCSRKYDGILPGMMCAGKENGGPDSCQGDSGGPLIKRDSQGKAILVGITSWGKGCGTTYGVYTRVSYYYEWIMKNTVD